MRSMIHNSVMMCSLRVCIVHLCLIKCAVFLLIMRTVVRLCWSFMKMYLVVLHELQRL